MKYFRRTVNTVFIMLGNSCNMNCAYCLQHPLVHEPLAAQINPEIYDFLEELSVESLQPIHLQFYGGEPLLYFDAIKEVVLEMEKRKLEMTLGVISNGRALTDEMVRFFNSHHFSVCISWDGSHVKETRGYDVFSNPETRERILAIEQLCLSGVISAKAYPKEILDAFQEISNEYNEIHGYQVAIDLDEIMDTGLPDRTLLEIDYKRVEQEIREMTLCFLEHLDKTVLPQEYTKFGYISQLFGALKHFYLDCDGKWESSTVQCGNGLSTLNLDLAGNLYPCHNTSCKAGTIHDGYFAYLQKILSGDHTREYRKGCLSCPALFFCKGGCKLVGKKAREETYCKLKQAVFTPVVLTVQEYGQAILEKHHG